MSFETQLCHSSPGICSSLLTHASNLPPKCKLACMVRKDVSIVVILGTHPYQIARASGGQHDPHGDELQTGWAQAPSLFWWKFSSKLFYNNNVSPPFLLVDAFPAFFFTPPYTPTHINPLPPGLPPHLPDVREVWEEPGGCLCSSGSCLPVKF